MSEVKLGHLVAIEGNNGVGKSTQIQLVAERLRAAGHDVVLVQEPGSSDLGVHLRKILKDQREIKLNYTTELLLFGAQRDDMYRKVIRPALDAGKVVLADRSYFSTYAFQVHPFMDQNQLILQLFNLMTSINISHLGNTPVIVANIAMDEAARLERLAGIPKREEDAFEELSPEILAKVNEGYALLEQQPGVTTFDGSKPQEELADMIFDQIQVCINQRVQEAEILRERAEAAANAPEPEAEAEAANTAEPVEPVMTLDALEAEILAATQHHVEQLTGMYGGNFEEHRGEFDAKVEVIKKWVKLHMGELAAKRPDGIPQMEGQQRIMQITGNIGTMLGGVMTLLNIGDMVAAAETGTAGQPAPAEEAESPAEQMANEASGYARGETPVLQHVDEVAYFAEGDDAPGMELRGDDTGGVKYDEASFHSEGVEGRNEAPGQ